MKNGREKPAIILTNDEDVKAEKVIRKYSHRWQVEKTISELAHIKQPLFIF